MLDARAYLRLRGGRCVCPAQHRHGRRLDTVREVVGEQSHGFSYKLSLMVEG